MALSGKGQNVLNSWAFNSNKRGNYTILLLTQRQIFNDKDNTEETIWLDWFFYNNIPPVESETFDPIGLLGFFGI